MLNFFLSVYIKCSLGDHRLFVVDVCCCCCFLFLFLEYIVQNIFYKQIHLILILSKLCKKDKKNKILLKPQYQAFRFMVGPGHCPMISKCGPSLSKAVGSVDPSFLVVKKSPFNKNVHFTPSLQKVHVG